MKIIPIELEDLLDIGWTVCRAPESRLKMAWSKVYCERYEMYIWAGNEREPTHFEFEDMWQMTNFIAVAMRRHRERYELPDTFRARIGSTTNGNTATC